MAPVRRNSWLKVSNSTALLFGPNARCQMSAVLKSRSEAEIAVQSRRAVTEVSVAPPNQGVSQLTSAESPLSFTSAVVSRLAVGQALRGIRHRITPRPPAQRIDDGRGRATRGGNGGAALFVASGVIDDEIDVQGIGRFQQQLRAHGMEIQGTVLVVVTWTDTGDYVD